MARTKLTCQCNLILEKGGKTYLLVTFIQQLVTKSKLSLIFTKTLLFPHIAAHFVNDRHDSTKMQMNKLIPVSKSTF